MIKETEKLVLHALKDVPETRNSDDLLYAQIIMAHGYCLDDYSIGEFLACRNQMGVPPFETVRRTRQKIQADHPELGGSETVRRNRAKLRQEFKGYAVNG